MLPGMLWASTLLQPALFPNEGIRLLGARSYRWLPLIFTPSSDLEPDIQTAVSPPLVCGAKTGPRGKSCGAFNHPVKSQRGMFLAVRVSTTFPFSTLREMNFRREYHGGRAYCPTALAVRLALSVDAGARYFI